MNEIRCLYLEHDKKAFARYSRAIRIRWKSIFGNDITLKCVTTIEDAIEEFALPDGTYQIFISDLLFPPVYSPKAKFDKHKPLGLDAIMQAKKKNSLLVIGLSIGSTISAADLREQSLKAGAHIFKYVSEVFESGSDTAAFCKEIHEYLLREKIIEDSIKLEYDSRDPGISYIVHEVGEGILKSLYKGVVGEEAKPQQLNATYIAPGLSGAFVVKVSAMEAKKPQADYLLKLSKIKSRLMSEISNYPKPGTYSSRLLVNYLGYDQNDIAHVGEWYAIGALFEKDTTPMLEWIKGMLDNESIHGVISSIFLNGGLGRGYVDVSDPDNPQSAGRALRPNLSRQARIFSALKDLDEVIRTPGLGGDPNWPEKSEVIKRYLMSTQLGHIAEEEMSKRCIMCQCHGDLHLRNVLITKSKPFVAIIIDTSDFGIYHWAADYGRVLVDLILAAYDHGIRLYQWQHMAHWKDLAAKVIRQELLPPDQQQAVSTDHKESDQNASVREAINWMTDNLGEICTEVEDQEKLEARLWELQLALAVEFMRGSYRPDLTAPKRVFALQAAYDALTAAESSFLQCREKSEKRSR